MNVVAHAAHYSKVTATVRRMNNDRASLEPEVGHTVRQ